MIYLEKFSLLIFILASNKLFSEGGDRLETFIVLILFGSIFLLVGQRDKDNDTQA